MAEPQTITVKSAKSGKTYEMPWDSPSDPSGKQVDDFIASQEKSLWEKANTGLVPVTKATEPIANKLYNYGESSRDKPSFLEKAYKTVTGIDPKDEAMYAGAGTQALGDTVEGMTSPINLALMAAGPVAKGLETAAPVASRILGMVPRIAGGAMAGNAAVEGIKNKDITQAIPFVLGALGAKGSPKVPQMTDELSQVKPIVPPTELPENPVKANPEFTPVGQEPPVTKPTYPETDPMKVMQDRVDKGFSKAGGGNQLSKVDLLNASAVADKAQELAPRKPAVRVKKGGNVDLLHPKQDLNWALKQGLEPVTGISNDDGSMTMRLAKVEPLTAPNPTAGIPSFKGSQQPLQSFQEGGDNGAPPSPNQSSLNAVPPVQSPATQSLGNVPPIPPNVSPGGGGLLPNPPLYPNAGGMFPTGPPKPKIPMSVGDDTFLKKLANISGSTARTVLGTHIPGTAISFHGFNEAVRNTLFGSFDPIKTAGRAGNALYYLANPGAANDYLNANFSELADAAKDGKVGLMGSYTNFKPLIPTSNWFGKGVNFFTDPKPLFQQVIPALKLKAYLGMRNDFQNQGMSYPDAAQTAGKAVNNIYGGLNLNVLERSPITQNLFRIAALAPDWLETNANLAKGMFKGITDPKNPASKVYQTGMANFLGSYIVANVLNAANNNGKFMFQNEPGHEFDIAYGSDVKGRTRYFSPYGTAMDMFRVPLAVAHAAVNGNWGRTFSDMRTRLSEPLQFATDLMSNSTGTGQPIFDKTKYGKPMSGGQQAGNVALDALGHFMPIGIDALADRAQGNISTEELAAKLLQAPMKYKMPQKLPHRSPMGQPR